MGGIFGGGSSGSTSYPSTAAVRYTDADQAEARSKATEKARKAAGALGTVKTSGQGLTSKATTSQKTLLGS